MLHTLLGGPSGIGKTHLAAAIAADMGTDLVEFYSSKSSKRIELIERIQKLQKPADVLFIDEIHALSSDCQEILYPAIDKNMVPEIDPAKKKVIEGKWVQIPAFTLIAATDQQGLIRNALNQRLTLKHILSWYRDDEMRQIVLNYASEMHLLLGAQACTRLAQAARGTPRRARQILSSLRVVIPDSTEPLTKTEVDRHLRMHQGIDRDNLTDTDHTYLRALKERGGTMSLENLANQIGLDLVAVKRDVETYLIREGWIGIGPRGRFLTEKGKALVAGGGR